MLVIELLYLLWHFSQCPNFHQPVLSIKCNPLAVSITPLTSPGFKAKAVTSNSFCMSPFLKYPKSPDFLALLQSLSVTASSPKVAAPDLIRDSWPCKILSASSLVRVTLASFQELGRRLSLCLISKCEARTLSGLSELAAAAAPPEPSVGWYFSMYALNTGAFKFSGGSQDDVFKAALK